MSVLGRYCAILWNFVSHGLSCVFIAFASSVFFFLLRPLLFCLHDSIFYLVNFLADRSQACKFIMLFTLVALKVSYTGQCIEQKDFATCVNGNWTCELMRIYIYIYTQFNNCYEEDYIENRGLSHNTFSYWVFFYISELDRISCLCKRFCLLYPYLSSLNHVTSSHPLLVVQFFFDPWFLKSTNLEESARFWHL